jgi:2-polyprenyl-6-methoxyphenol hydroxylase-like FAD-dependent oxidoreductase
MAHDQGGVLVAGAGPTGLLLAGDLAEAGVPVTVVERRDRESNLSRAFAVHARTLEQLDARGLADELIATGQRLTELRFLRGARLGLDTLPSRFPFVLITPQYQAERLLERRARAAGAEIVTGTEVTGLQDGDDGVLVRTRGPDGAAGERRAAYLAGTDGVRSTVRHALRLPFPGKSVLRSVMLADVRLARPPADVLTVSANHAGLAFVAPFGDGWYRVIAWNRHHEVPDTAPVDLAEIRQLMRDVLGTDFGLGEARWTSRFHNDERQALRYRAGRVFLAGDAAHVHSPAGGQGMNTGLQDAANLSWKLAAVAKGRPDGGLLDTYHAERYPVGRFVRRLSHGLLRLALVEPGALRQAAALAAQAAGRLPLIAGRAAESISGIGIGYPAGPRSHPLAGRRAPDIPLAGSGPGRLYEALRDGRFVLLADDGRAAAASGWAGELTQAVPGGGPARMALVRPDGYYAWATDESDPAARDSALRQALTDWCGEPRQAAGF